MDLSFVILKHTINGAAVGVLSYADDSNFGAYQLGRAELAQAILCRLDIRKMRGRIVSFL